VTPSPPYVNAQVGPLFDGDLSKDAFRHYKKTFAAEIHGLPRQLLAGGAQLSYTALTEVRHLALKFCDF